MIKKYIEHKFSRQNKFIFNIYSYSYECLNCGVIINKLLASLTELDRIKFNKLKDNYNILISIEQEKYLNKVNYIQKCITEEEYIIKNIIE